MSASVNTASVALDSSLTRPAGDTDALEVHSTVVLLIDVAGIDSAGRGQAVADAAWRVVNGLDRLRRVCETEWTFRFFDSREAEAAADAEKQHTEFFRGSDRGWQVFCNKFETVSSRERKGEVELGKVGERCQKISSALESALGDMQPQKGRAGSDFPAPQNETISPQNASERVSSELLGAPPPPAQSSTAYGERMVVKHNVKRKALVVLIAPKPEVPEELASFTAEGLQRIGKRFREEKSRAIWVCCDMDVLKPTKPSQRNQTPNTSQCGSQQCGKEDSRHLNSESNIGQGRRVSPELARALQVVFSGQGRIISSALLRKGEGLGWVLLRGRGDSKSRARLFAPQEKQPVLSPPEKIGGPTSPRIRREGTIPKSSTYAISAQSRLEAVGDFDGKLKLPPQRFNADAGEAPRASAYGSVLNENGQNIRAQDVRVAMLPQHRRAREIQRFKKSAGGRSGGIRAPATELPPMAKKLSGRGSQLLALSMQGVAIPAPEPVRNLAAAPHRLHISTAKQGEARRPVLAPRKDEGAGPNADTPANIDMPSDVEVEDHGAGGDDSDGDSVEGNLPGACPVETELRSTEATLLKILGNPCGMPLEETAEKIRVEVGKALSCVVKMSEDEHDERTGPRDALRGRLLGNTEKQRGGAAELLSAERIKTEVILRLEISAGVKTGTEALDKPEDPPAKKLRGKLTELLRRLQLFEGGQLHVFFNSVLISRYGATLPKTLKYLSKKLEIEEEDVPSLGGVDPCAGLPETASVGGDGCQGPPNTSAAGASQGSQREVLWRASDSVNHMALKNTTGPGKNSRGMPMRRGYDSRLVRIGTGIRKPFAGTKSGRGGLRRSTAVGNAHMQKRSKVRSPVKSLSRNLHAHSLQHVKGKTGDGGGPSSPPGARSCRKGKKHVAKRDRLDPDADKCIMETPLRAARASAADKEAAFPTSPLAPLPMMSLGEDDEAAGNGVRSVARSLPSAVDSSDDSESDAGSDVVPETIKRTPPRPKTTRRSPPAYNFSARMNEFLSDGHQTGVPSRTVAAPPRWGSWMVSATQEASIRPETAGDEKLKSHADAQLRAFSESPDGNASVVASSEDGSPAPATVRRALQTHTSLLPAGILYAGRLAAPMRVEDGNVGGLEAKVASSQPTAVPDTTAPGGETKGTVEAEDVEGGIEQRGQAAHVPSQPTCHDSMTPVVELKDATATKGNSEEGGQGACEPSHSVAVLDPTAPHEETTVPEMAMRGVGGSEEGRAANPLATQPPAVPGIVAAERAAADVAGGQRVTGKRSKNDPVEVADGSNGVDVVQKTFIYPSESNATIPKYAIDCPVDNVELGPTAPVKTQKSKGGRVEKPSKKKTKQAGNAGVSAKKAGNGKKGGKSKGGKAKSRNDAPPAPAKLDTEELELTADGNFGMTTCDLCRMESKERTRRGQEVVKCRRCVKCRQVHCHDHSLQAWGRGCFSAKALKASKPCKPCTRAEGSGRKAGADGPSSGRANPSPEGSNKGGETSGSGGCGMPGTGTLLMPDTPRPVQSEGDAPNAGASMRVGFAHVPFHTSASFVPATMDIIRKRLDMSEGKVSCLQERGVTLKPDSGAGQVPRSHGDADGERASMVTPPRAPDQTFQLRLKASVASSGIPDYTPAQPSGGEAEQVRPVMVESPGTDDADAANVDSGAPGEQIVSGQATGMLVEVAQQGEGEVLQVHTKVDEVGEKTGEESRSKESRQAHDQRGVGPGCNAEAFIPSRSQLPGDTAVTDQCRTDEEPVAHRGHGEPGQTDAATAQEEGRRDVLATEDEETQCFEGNVDVGALDGRHGGKEAAAQPVSANTNEGHEDKRTYRVAKTEATSASEGCAAKDWSNTPTGGVGEECLRSEEVRPVRITRRRAALSQLDSAGPTQREEVPTLIADKENERAKVVERNSVKYVEGLRASDNVLHSKIVRTERITRRTTMAKVMEPAGPTRCDENVAGASKKPEVEPVERVKDSVAKDTQIVRQKGNGVDGVGGEVLPSRRVTRRRAMSRVGGKGTSLGQATTVASKGCGDGRTVGQHTHGEAEELSPRQEAEAETLEEKADNPEDGQPIAIETPARQIRRQLAAAVAGRDAAVVTGDRNAEARKLSSPVAGLRAPPHTPANAEALDVSVRGIKRVHRQSQRRFDTAPSEQQPTRETPLQPEVRAVDGAQDETAEKQERLSDDAAAPTASRPAPIAGGKEGAVVAGQAKSGVDETAGKVTQRNSARLASGGPADRQTDGESVVETGPQVRLDNEQGALLEADQATKSSTLPIVPPVSGGKVANAEVLAKCGCEGNASEGTESLYPPVVPLSAGQSVGCTPEKTEVDVNPQLARRVTRRALPKVVPMAVTEGDKVEERKAVAQPQSKTPAERIGEVSPTSTRRNPQAASSQRSGGSGGENLHWAHRKPRTPRPRSPRTSPALPTRDGLSQSPAPRKTATPKPTEIRLARRSLANTAFAGAPAPSPAGASDTGVEATGAKSQPGEPTSRSVRLILKSAGTIDTGRPRQVGTTPRVGFSSLGGPEASGAQDDNVVVVDTAACAAAHPGRKNSGSVVPNSQPSSTEDEVALPKTARRDGHTPRNTARSGKRVGSSGRKPAKRQRLSNATKAAAGEAGGGREVKNARAGTTELEKPRRQRGGETGVDAKMGEGCPESRAVGAKVSQSEDQLLTFARAMAPPGRSPEDYATELRRVLEANNLLSPNLNSPSSQQAARPEATPKAKRQPRMPTVVEEEEDGEVGRQGSGVHQADVSPVAQIGVDAISARTPSGAHVAVEENGNASQEEGVREPSGADGDDNGSWGWLGAVLTPMASAFRMVRRASLGPAGPSPSPPPTSRRWDNFAISPGTQTLLDTKPPTPFMTKFGDKSSELLDPVATPSAVRRGLQQDQEHSLTTPNSTGVCAQCNPVQVGARRTPCERCIGPQLPVGSDSLLLDNSDPRGSNARFGRQFRRGRDRSDHVNQSLEFLSVSPEETTQLQARRNGAHEGAPPASARGSSGGGPDRTARAARGLFKREREESAAEEERWAHAKRVRKESGIGRSKGSSGSERRQQPEEEFGWSDDGAISRQRRSPRGRRPKLRMDL